MQNDGVACSRCGATFESQDDLIVHSIDTHAGIDSSSESPHPQADAETAGGPGAGATAAASTPEPITEAATAGAATARLDTATVERLTTALEAQAAGGVTASYGQRFITIASVAILAVAVGLSYLHFTGVLDTTVFMFALGTLFGLTLSYLQMFLQSVRG